MQDVKASAMHMFVCGILCRFVSAGPRALLQSCAMVKKFVGDLGVQPTRSTAQGLHMSLLS